MQKVLKRHPKQNEQPGRCINLDEATIVRAAGDKSDQKVVTYPDALGKSVNKR